MSIRPFFEEIWPLFLPVLKRNDGRYALADVAGGRKVPQHCNSPPHNPTSGYSFCKERCYAPGRRGGGDQPEVVVRERKEDGDSVSDPNTLKIKLP